MITAIPMSRDKIASHFSKADSFVFIDQQGTQLAQLPNPGLQAGCAAKAEILTLLRQQQVERVIVRNIGERLLSRLLNAELSVFQIGSSHWDSPQFLADAPRYLLPLTAAEQGRPSIKYQQKQANGGCGCDHEHSADGSASCCCQHSDTRQTTEQHVAQRCCQRGVAHTGKSAKSHCCH